MAKWNATPMAKAKIRQTSKPNTQVIKDDKENDKNKCYNDARHQMIHITAVPYHSPNKNFSMVFPRVIQISTIRAFIESEQEKQFIIQHQTVIRGAKPEFD
jgi:hypothetical protein